MPAPDSTPCPQCGAEVRETDRFCGACGFDLTAHRASSSGRAVKQTMVGLSPPSTHPPRAAAAAQPSEPPAEGADIDGPPTRPSRRPAPTNRTMLGMPSPVRASGQAAESGAEGPSGSAPSSGPGSIAPPKLGATQVGLRRPEGLPEEGAEGGEGDRPKATRLGVPTAETSPVGQSPSPGGRTMLGMPASVPPPSESMRPAAMAAAAPPAVDVPRPRNPVAYGSDFPPADPDLGAPVGARPPPAGRMGRLPWVLIGLGGLLAVVAAAVAIAWAVGSGGPEVEASVVMTDRGEMLEVTVPAARPGTKVRLGDAELALEGNQARFPLAADGLAVGDNTLALDVVSPEGAVETAEVTLQVGFRVRADLSTLRDATPAVRIAVDAPPGTDATLDGEALALDAEGKGDRRYELPAAAADEDGSYDLSVAYHLELPSGEVEDGRVRTRIPYASLQLDKPGRSVVIDTGSVEVAGGVESGATVTVDGAPVDLADGRFREVVPIESLGERTIQVVARQPGRAPARVEIRVRRVEDLAKAARGFEADPSLTYVRIVQNPSIYRGQKVRMTGRVYNVRVEDGRSTLQVLVKECPRGEACPLWVVYPAATDATLNDWVEILGEVAGEQQFKAESDRIVTVPRVDALYVLEARP